MSQVVSMKAAMKGRRTKIDASLAASRVAIPVHQNAIGGWSK
jgi:hypothetical protein